ncbi:EF-hand calcium-binding domain-containing protein 14 isoform X4 [Pipistrellus kuhlii]|uniref:EF-hand calcium-binding domain-containing protein 14 isoform X4 n=1 Tax=Pipistrellus kuhlii TaxID=59472 RepID=UPI00174F4C14|nr:EF-hand calcium-binding domain-containing protein 14 isoform X4 [Pipistrellus kuhlii]
MKKRKELNALIGLSGDSRRKKPKKGSGHRLLRTEPPASDSESSSVEEEEFDVDGNRSCFVKGDYLRCCKICYPLCAFVILAACVVACVGLVWMQVALKEDLDTLKEKFRTMESNQKSSFQEIPKLNEELLSKQRELEKIESGELGLSKVWINITEMNKQSVASIGNTLNSVHLAVEAIQKTVDEHKKAMELLQRDLNQYSMKETSRSSQIIPSPSAPSELDNKSHSKNMKQIGDRAATLKRESLHQVTSRIDTLKTQSIKKEDSSDSQVSKVREKLQLISALSNKPESNRPPETTHEEQVQSFTSKPSALPEFPQSPGDDIEKTAQLRSVSIPGIASIKDLQDLFHKTGQNMDGELTYQEIWNLLGSTMPAPESLREFDADGDGRYSFLELRTAVGV